ncbi:MAG: beta-galactosidase [Clostridia bacterium]|nr:beta-galactosidase [Clostridia bacterium]
MDFLQHYSVGVCYYPEHWPESIWEEDLRRMLDSGIHTVRVAEFSWSLMEREEGIYDFTFWDRFLELCAKVGMQVIFGTPTATPPAWLTETYPETLNADETGALYYHGGRRHYNYNIPVYRYRASRLITELAKRYGRHPAIVGWQIDNELNCEINDFLSASDTEAFRSFLVDKYGTLEALNSAWGTVFWSQTYTEWEQIFVPRHNTIHSHNPSLLLDYVRFVSESALSFCAMQAQILRQFTAGQFITTNGMFGRMDNHRMTKESLDCYMYDSYPDFAYGIDNDWTKDDLHDRRSSLNLLQVHSICPHFGIMEQQSGANGWYNRMEAPMPRPGQLELWAMQSVAHGADYISFFRWRTSPVGTEIYWHGILDYDGRDNRRLREVKAFSKSLEKIAAVCGADTDARFGVLQDYNNLFDADIDHWHRRVHQASEQGIFRAALKHHVTYDIVDVREDTPEDVLGRYPVLFLPDFIILTPHLVSQLSDYVKQGGKLIVGCRTGYKDETGKCPMHPMPGLLAPLTGTTVEEYTFASPAEPEAKADWDGKTIPAALFMESLKAEEGTEVLARYTDSFLKGEALLTRHAVGEGEVYHLGTTFSEAVVSALMTYLGLAEPYSTVLSVPATVEVVGRVKGGKKWLFVLNYEPTQTKVLVHAPLRELLTGKEMEGETVIPAYGVWVLEI